MCLTENWPKPTEINRNRNTTKTERFPIISVGFGWELHESKIRLWLAKTKKTGRTEPITPLSVKVTLKSPSYSLASRNCVLITTRRVSSKWNKASQRFLTSKPSFSEIFNNFDQFLLSLTQSRSWVGPKTLILIRLSEQVETNAITNIIKISYQRLFMGQNWS